VEHQDYKILRDLAGGVSLEPLPQRRRPGCCLAKSGPHREEHLLRGI
jgi:hypothetical protein